MMDNIRYLYEQAEILAKSSLSKEALSKYDNVIAECEKIINLENVEKEIKSGQNKCKTRSAFKKRRG